MQLTLIVLVSLPLYIGLSLLASYGHEGINLIGKIVSAAMLWYGARLVMEQQLSVGQFVAFNMFAQRVAQLIMRMAYWWTDFQQTGISMARLGDILTRVPRFPRPRRHNCRHCKAASSSTRCAFATVPRRSRCCTT